MRRWQTITGKIRGGETICLHVSGCKVKRITILDPDKFSCVYVRNGECVLDYSRFVFSSSIIALLPTDVPHECVRVLARQTGQRSAQRRVPAKEGTDGEQVMLGRSVAARILNSPDYVNRHVHRNAYRCKRYAQR